MKGAMSQLLRCCSAPLRRRPARAAPFSPGLHVVATDVAARPPAGSRSATSQRGYLLVQYGGGGDDDPLMVAVARRDEDDSG